MNFRELANEIIRAGLLKYLLEKFINEEKNLIDSLSYTASRLYSLSLTDRTTELEEKIIYNLGIKRGLELASEILEREIRTLAKT